MTNMDLHVQTALLIKLSSVIELENVKAAAEVVFNQQVLLKVDLDWGFMQGQSCFRFF